MMYKQGLAAAIKLCGNKGKGSILREFNGDTVYLPFGSEYSIVLNNKQSVRASVKVEIDGQDVMDGHAVLIDANSSFELERFLRNGNLDAGNRFKFIERTSTVERGRGGIRTDDGLVRIEYQFEDVPKYTTTTTHHHHHDIHHYHNRYGWPYNTLLGGWSGGTGGGLNAGDWLSDNFEVKCSAAGALRSSTAGGEAPRAMNMANVKTKGASAQSLRGEVHDSFNDAGVTAPGSKSEQSFRLTAPIRLLPDTHVLIFKLLGKAEDEAEVVAPVTVKTKVTCSTCKTRNKATAKFCAECGTALELF